MKQIIKGKEYKVIPTNWSHKGLCTSEDGQITKWFKKDKLNKDDVWKQLQEDGKGYPENGITNPPLVIVTESTFMSYDPIGRNEVIEDILKRGNLILTISPRATAHKRFALGRMGMKLTNKMKMTSANQKLKEENDTKVIYEIIKEGKVHLKVPQLVVIDFSEPAKCFELHRRHDFEQWTGKPVLQDPSTVMNKDGKPSIEFQKMWCKDAKLKLKKPKYEYEWKIVAPMYLAYLKSNGNIKNFERLVGCNSSGYPSFARATWYRRIFSTQMHRRSSAKKGIILTPRLSQTDARRVTRQLFHIFKSSDGKCYPENGM